MKTYVLFLGLLVPTISLSQQIPCSQEASEQKEGTWHKDPDASPARAGTANLAKQQEVVKKISDIVSELYPKPRGGEIFWYGGYDILKIVDQYPNSYTNNIILKTYKCANNKESLVAYSSSLFVFVNGLGFMSNNLEMNGKQYSTVRALTYEKDGYKYFNFDPNDKYSTQEEWILTYKDKLPYTCLTRKEYITEARADQAKKMEAAIANDKKVNKVRPQAEQDAERQKMISNFSKSYQGKALEDRIAQFNRDYKPDQQRLDEALNYTNNSYSKILKTYDDFLASHSEDYLSQPAIVLPYTRANFDGFDNKMNDPNLVYIISSNPSYYNKNLPVSSPQYISVLLRHLKSGKADNLFYDNMNQKILLDKLASLLGQ